MKHYILLLLIFISSLSTLSADPLSSLSNSCGYFPDAISTRAACSGASAGKIEFIGEANIYDNPDSELATCSIITPQWILDRTETCESGDCTAVPGNSESFTIDYSAHPFVSVNVDNNPSNDTTDKTIDSDMTLSDSAYDDINFNYAGVSKTATFEQSRYRKKTTEINTITSVWNVLFKDSEDIKVGTITGATYTGPYSLINTGTVDKIEIHTINFVANSLINLTAQTHINIDTFTVGRDSSQVTLKAENININTLTVSNNGSGAVNITIYADTINIGVLDMNQDATVTILPYTTGGTVLFKSTTVSASSSSELILASGDYYMSNFDVPGTSNSSSVRALDANQVVNFYINNDFAPGNNPGINSAGNNGAFGSLPPLNFRMFINGDLTTGGGGTTFNAIVYIEGDATLGSPTYIKGALSANSSIDIDNNSKIYYSADINTAGFGACVTAAPDEQNEYACGIFNNVLTTYDSITSIGNNDEAFNTESISYPANSITGDILCKKNEESCTREDPPANTLNYTVYKSSKLGTSESTPSSDLTDLEYGNFNGNFDLTLNPSQTTTEGTPVMLLGDITLTGANTLSFAPGDYYINSLTFSKNNPDIVLTGNAPVRIFIKENFIVTKNGLNVNENGSPSDFFVYVEGDMDFQTNGNVETLKGFFYVKGSVKLDANSQNFNVHGGITAEGPIAISGQNGDFYQDSDADNLGYGKCQMCFAAKDESGFGFGPISFMSSLTIPIHNISNKTLNNIKVYETYESTSSFSIMSTRNVVDQDGNVIGTADSIDTQDYGFAGIAGVNLKSTGNIYNIGDNYTANGYPSSTYRATHSSTLFSMNSSGFNNWKNQVHYFTSYTDNSNRSYSNMKLEICEDTDGGSSYQTGPFDAWDTSLNIEKRNILTKIVSKDFNLTIASINHDGNDTEAKENIDIQYRLFDDNTLKNITPWEDYNASSSKKGEKFTKNFIVNKAYRNVHVQFKICMYADQLYSLAHCENNNSIDTNITRSTDSFAIRPNKFTITGIDNGAYLTAAKNLKYTITAKNGDETDSVSASASASDSVNYDISDKNYSLDIKVTKYNKNDIVDNTLSGDASIVPSTFINGVSTDTNVTYSEVGKVNLNIEDRNWAIVDEDDTDKTCDGMYICGDTNATFIPDHFKLTSVSLHNANDSTYTYLSNDLNISAGISVTITAENESNNTTVNFDKNSWENPVNVAFTLPSTGVTNIVELKSDINTSAELGFSSGIYIINSTDTNSSANLVFNYKRSENDPQNPFVVQGSEITLNVNSTYNTELVTGEAKPDNNATFIYGRTHAARHIFTGNSGEVFIYYEAYCYGETNGNTCNKNLLPDALNSKNTDDPRWFQNTKHNSTTDGKAVKTATIFQKNPLHQVTTTNLTSGNPEKATLNYAGTSYPYKTTMQNTPSTWLIYDKYKSDPTSNEFEVEFTNSSVSWAGKHETNTTTTNTATDRTNRRSMW